MNAKGSVLPSFPASGASLAPSNHETLPMRPATHNDLEFLRALYGSTREDELAATSWTYPQKDMFLDMQFGLQHRSYLAAFPKAHFLIIEHDGHRIGRLYLDTVGPRWHIIDLALMPACRGQGKGSAILRDLQWQASETSKPIGLQVDRRNERARSLYLRLSFREVGESSTHDLLIWP